MSIIKRLEGFVAKVFKTTLEVFLEALKLSPNAQGYVSGSITELLLKRHLESLGFIVERIREKWEGKKHPKHYGDFYFKGANNDWFVLESKGVKSNSEKWHGLYNYEKLKSFLFSHKDKINWINEEEGAEQQIDQWITENLPKFLNEYNDVLYNYEEIKNYQSPQKETPKSIAIERLKDYSRKEIAEMIDERLSYLMDKVKILETHFVSGVGGSSGRTQATPKKDEFNLISVDIFLRFSEHKFLFANPQNLESSGADVNHLQQNYIMGFVFNNNDLCLSDEWHNNFIQILATVDKNNAVNEADKQVDNRNVIYDE